MTSRLGQGTSRHPCPNVQCTLSARAAQSSVHCARVSQNVHWTFGQGCLDVPCPSLDVITMLHVQCYVNGFSRFVTRPSREAATHSELKIGSKRCVRNLSGVTSLREIRPGQVRDVSGTAKLCDHERRITSEGDRESKPQWASLKHALCSHLSTDCSTRRRSAPCGAVGGEMGTERVLQARPLRFAFAVALARYATFVITKLGRPRHIPDLSGTYLA